MTEGLDVGELSRRYGPMVLRRCRRLLRDDAEALDACQDVFVRVIERLLFGGPYLAFIAKSTQTVGGVESDLDSQLKGADAGVLLGAGIEVGARRGAVVLETRFAIGLRDLSEASDTTFKSRTFMASFGYRF